MTKKTIFVGIILSTILTATNLTSLKPNYNTNENIVISFSEMSQTPQNWIGIFQQDSSTQWNNIIAWRWTKDHTNGTVNFNPLPVGHYEARAFYNNSYKVEVRKKFTVVARKKESLLNKTKYSAYGEYIFTKKIIDPWTTVYKPKKNMIFKKNVPVVIISTGGWGSPIQSYEEFIRFIVSKGYFVIGVSTQANRDDEFKRILNTLNQQGDLIDKSKIGFIGNSTGGGTPFYTLKHLKEEGYASNSFIVSLDGTFALGLKSKEIKDINTTTLFLQFGGKDGVKNGRYQDPRISMYLYNILPGQEKAFSYLNNGENSHAYPQGSMKNKEDLLNIIGAMLAYKFENAGQEAKNIALDDKHNEIKVPNHANIDKKYEYKCTWSVQDNIGKYDYCDLANSLK